MGQNICSLLDKQGHPNNCLCSTRNIKFNKIMFVFHVEQKVYIKKQGTTPLFLFTYQYKKYNCDYNFKPYKKHFATPLIFQNIGIIKNVIAVSCRCYRCYQVVFLRLAIQSKSRFDYPFTYISLSLLVVACRVSCQVP